MGFKRVETLGEHVDHDVGVAVCCRRCRRYVELEAGPLIPARGSNRRPETLRFRCTGCGAAGPGAIAVGKEARWLGTRR